MPWPVWLFAALMVCAIVALLILSIMEEYRHRNDGPDDDVWRDDYTGWG